MQAIIIAMTFVSGDSCRFPWNFSKDRFLHRQSLGHAEHAADDAEQRRALDCHLPRHAGGHYRGSVGAHDYVQKGGIPCIA